MDSAAQLASAVTFGYLLGSVSFAQVLARARGVDLRRVGSGNLGATNAGRALGRRLGVLVYVLDAAKGALPAGLPLLLGWPLGAAALGGAGACAGHVWPLWLGFRGGKGVATYSGAMLVLDPLAVLLGALALAVSVGVCRIMSLGSIVLGLTVPVAVWALDPSWSLGPGWPVLAFAAASGLLFFYTHRSNLARIRAGTEARIGARKP